MRSRKEIIHSLEQCSNDTDDACRSCSYRHFDAETCVQHLIKDVLALLNGNGKVYVLHRCLKNEFVLIEDDEYNFCPYCGMEIRR